MLLAARLPSAPRHRCTPWPRSSRRVVAMASKKNDDNPKRKVVVVGGGFAGRRVHRLLNGQFDVTLIDAKGYWEYTPAALRCMVEPEHAKSCLVPLPKGSVVGNVVGLELGPSDNGDPTGSMVRLSDGSEHPFHYCVLCTGSSYPAPIKPDMHAASSVASRVDEYRAAFKDLEGASRVVVVGGGTVGVELAAEVAGKWGDAKEVTLVASQDCLLERMAPNAGRYALKWLKAKGVRVILGERITDWGGAVGTGRSGIGGGGATLKTNTGRAVEADSVFKCVGFEPLAGAVAKGSLAAAVGPRGGVGVGSSLQVAGARNVFAVGDCALTSEEKTAFSADLGATLAARNVQRMAKGEPLLTFPQGVCFGAASTPNISAVSLYKWCATMQFNNLVISGWLAAVVKWAIEFLQVATARGIPVLSQAWDAIEVVMVYLAKYLFTGGGGWWPQRAKPQSVYAPVS